MASFFEFVFGNIIFIIIIIAAIYNALFKGKNQEDKNTEKAPRRQGTQVGSPSRSDSTRSAPRTLKEKMETVFSELEKNWTDSTEETEEKPTSQAKSIPLGSFELQRKEQYDRLRSQYQSVEEEVQHVTEYNELLSSKSTQKHETVKVNAHKNITKQGLIEGVIMAEVLGPPRALNPYKNVVQKRRQ